MERKYLVYRIIGPTGIYVGATMQTLSNRWTSHKTRAKRGYNHPFAEAIREYGFECFSPIMITSNLTKSEAHELEAEYIALYKKLNKSYNISPGGDFDHITGSWIHWEKYNTDPAYKAEYTKKLIAGMINGKQRDYDYVVGTALQWRKDNAREAWKLSYRGLRLANKANSLKFAHLPVQVERSLKERLLWKFKRGKMTGINVAKTWSKRDENARQVIANKVSKTLKEKNKNLTAKEKMAMVSKARTCIDRSIQGPAASKGIKNFWIELKKDPVKFREHMDKKTAKMMETRNALKK